MARALPIAACVLVLCGCASVDRTAVLYSAAADPGTAPRAPNLALGPTAEHAVLSEMFAYRTRWPSVETGYRFDELSYSTDVQLDDQSFYDRLGGWFERDAETVRTSVLMH